MGALVRMPATRSPARLLVFFSRLLRARTRRKLEQTVSAHGSSFFSVHACVLSGQLQCQAFSQLYIQAALVRWVGRSVWHGQLLSDFYRCMPLRRGQESVPRAPPAPPTRNFSSAWQDTSPRNAVACSLAIT